MKTLVSPFKKIRLTVCLIVFLPWIGAGFQMSAAAAPVRYVLAPEASSVHFDAQATMHAFTGDSKTLSGEMVWDAQTQQISEGAVVRVPIMLMTTGMIKRDHSMRRMFEATQYPDVAFRVARVTLLAVTANESGLTPNRYRLEGVLKIRQIEHAVTIEVMEKNMEAGTLEVSGETEVLLDWFELKPPVAFGMMRVLPNVKIRFMSVWKPA